METIDNLEDEAAEVQKPEGMPPLRPDEPVPAEDFSMEDSVVVLDEIYPPEMPAPPKKRIRPEWILAAIALLAAAALAWVAILCRPYYKAADDPEALVVRRHHEEMTEPPVSPEPETEPEETEPTSEPTIPPEPNPYGRLDFQYNNHNYLTCLRTDSYSGVDVSAFQGTSTGRRSPVPALTLPSSALGTAATAAASWWRTNTHRRISRARRKRGFPSAHTSSLRR